MGCDIHFVVEYRPKHPTASWVGVYSTDLTPRMRIYAESSELRLPDSLASYHRGPEVKTRNYAFFDALAGVRGNGPQTPKGVPGDASALSDYCIAEWDPDGHSHSWDTLVDFCMKWALVCRDDAKRSVATAYMIGEATMDEIVSVIKYLMGEYIYENDYSQYRVVYWFDN